MQTPIVQPAVDYGARPAALPLCYGPALFNITNLRRNYQFAILLPVRLLILHYLFIWPPLAYLLILAGMALEGDAILFTTAFLTHRGLLQWEFALPAAILGLFLGDWGWYGLGRRLKRPAWFLNYADNLTRPLQKHLESNLLRTVFVSKFAYGMGHIVSFRLGSQGMAPREFFKSNTLASIPWFTLVAGLGFASSASFLLVKRYLRFAEIGILAGVVILLAVQHFLRYRWDKNKNGDGPASI